MGGLLIVGAGAAGRLAFEAALDVHETLGGPTVAGFIDDHTAGQHVNGLPVLGDVEWLLAQGPDRHDLVCGVGNPLPRRHLTTLLEEHGFTFVSLIHPSARISRFANIGNGVVVLHNCVIQPNAVVGDHVFVNYACNIGHDVILERFTCVMTGSNVGGGSVLREGCYVGIGATILPGTVVGEESTVGAGAVVIRNVEPGTKVAGCPAKPLASR